MSAFDALRTSANRIRLRTSSSFALLVTLLWLVIAATIIVFAGNVAHFSPWEFIIPGPDPWTWLAPLALFGTPLLLAVSKAVSRPLGRGLIWLALLLLVLPVLGFLAVIIFPKQTGYYDPDDPDRQPDNTTSLITTENTKTLVVSASALPAPSSGQRTKKTAPSGIHRDNRVQASQHHSASA